MKGTAEMLSNPPFWAEIVSKEDDDRSGAFPALSALGLPAGAAGSQAGLLVELFRVWAQARAARANPLPAMFDRAMKDCAGYGSAGHEASSPELVTACQSLFELTEACLGRALVAASVTSPQLSPDEQGIVALLDAAAQSGPTRTSSLIPHGLPGALTWAAYAVNRALATPIDSGITATACPFAQTGAAPDR